MARRADQAFAKWAINDAERFKAQKGEECVVVAKALPVEQSGQPYLMGITSDPKKEEKPPGTSDGYAPRSLRSLLLDERMDFNPTLTKSYGCS